MNESPPSPSGSAGGGGFMPRSLPSPPPSSAYSTSAIATNLPRQRRLSLRPGCAKETAVINFVDSHILSINRRHAKKFSSAFTDKDETEAERGYENFREVAKDIEAIVDVLWVSATPSLQIPYLITLAGLLNTYLPDFPFSARATFKLIRKFDAIFASLLLGEDLQTGAPLPGFEGKHGVVSMTEKVRIKSIAESARIIVVGAQENGDDEQYGDDDEDDDGIDGDGDGRGGESWGTEDFGDGLGRWDLESGRVYQRTIQILGDELGKQDG
ncbi:hypothetical protein PABG_01161 [Paracoccidioides brasiliensis Pb03]|nr:hypothetical protein PABG_01161 [Paracoccidioides brasiliensis Pb03]